MYATIREAAQQDWDRIRDFYQCTQYYSPINPSDRILIAEARDRIVGAVRLCCEGGIQVLRGMRVLELMRHQGIGTDLLDATIGVLGNDACYCIPYVYLEGFYAHAGFHKLPLDDAPTFLRQRWAEYTRRGLKVIVMRRSG
jgi:N-acetylglutamate synthase-like GNAT family acetyltransferase